MKEYPLPWCAALDKPYWKLNLHLCLTEKGWANKQAHKTMSEIIPWIDERIAKKEIVI